MDEKRTPLVKEEPKHKKKSKNNGLPRSKHKHTYETVLLYKYFSFPDIKTGKSKVLERVVPTKVCSICGRVGDVDLSYYRYILVDSPFTHKKYRKEELIEEAFDLPKYYIEDYLDKFATKIEEKQLK